MTTHSWYSCLGNSMDRGARRAIVHGVMKESDITERLKQQQHSITKWSYWGLEKYLRGSSGKESACSVGDPGSVSGLGRFPWRREWQPTPVFLPGESRGQRSLAGYSPWGHKESDTEWLTLSLFSWPPDHAPGDWGALALSFVPNSLDAVLLTPKNTLPERNSRK